MVPNVYAAAAVVGGLPEAVVRDIAGDRVSAENKVALHLAGEWYSPDGPFLAAFASDLTDVVASDGLDDRELAGAMVRAAWWALRLARRDTSTHQVLTAARSGGAWWRGYMEPRR